MEIQIDQKHLALSENRLGFVRITHPNQEDLLWRIDIFRKTLIHFPTDFFKQINQFFSQLDPSVQAKIFHEFEQAAHELETFHESFAIKQKLQKRVKAIYEHITFDHIRRFLLTYCEIDIPETVHQSYDTDTQQDERKMGRTYLYNDYLDLVALTLYLKPLVPIFGEYLNQVKDEDRVYKELSALGLFKETKFFELPPVVRLRWFISATIEDENYRISTLIKGLGSEELPEWYLARLVVRKLAMCETMHENNVISALFHYLKNQINSLDKNFGGKISNKKIEKNDALEEDKSSVMERYRIKEKNFADVMVYLRFFVQNYEAIAKKIDPTIDLNKVRVCVANMEKLTHLQSQPFQYTLSQWIFPDAVSPRAIPRLNKISRQHHIFAVTQAILWHWGFLDLAVLMAAQPTAIKHSSPTKLKNINKKQFELLQQIYPHYKRSTGDDQKPVDRAENVASNSIKTISDQLNQHDWEFFGPQALVEEAGYQDAHFIVIPIHLNHLLADLLLKSQEVRYGHLPLFEPVSL